MLLNAISDFIQRSGLRKWSIAVLVILVTAFLLYHAKLDAKSYVDINFWVIMGVFCANAFENFCKMKIGNGKNGTENGENKEEKKP